MPACSAFSTGALKACRSISDTAIPSALEATAVFMALIIWLTLLVSEPVHSYEQPSSLQASAMPYWVGVKKVFVVTWLTNTNLYEGCEPKTSFDTLPPAALVLLVPPPPQASRSALAPPAATPVSAARRRNARRSKPGARPSLGGSAYSKRSTASWATSVSDISHPPPCCEARRERQRQNPGARLLVHS